MKTGCDVPMPRLAPETRYTVGMAVYWRSLRCSTESQPRVLRQSSGMLPAIRYSLRLHRAPAVAACGGPCFAMPPVISLSIVGRRTVSRFIIIRVVGHDAFIA
jgi:hypothetical protein